VTALHVKDDALKSMRIRLEILRDRVGDLLVLIAAEADWHQDDARVPRVRGDRVVSEPEEVDDVPCDDRAPLDRRELQLRTVLEIE